MRDAPKVAPGSFPPLGTHFPGQPEGNSGPGFPKQIRTARATHRLCLCRSGVTERRLIKVQIIDDIPVWGRPIDQDSLKQINTCHSIFGQAAMMADHHKGYGVPIGGVIAY
jgi:hypothetical protein